MKYGYIRVSIPLQETNYSTRTQKDALLHYGVAESNLFVEVLNGETFDQPVLEKLTRELDEGDELVVTHIDRLGRNLPQTINFILELDKKGIQFTALKMPEGMEPRLRWFLLSVMAWLAEAETKQRRERQAIGIARAKMEPGKYMGRRTVITEEIKKEILEDLSMERPITRIAKRLGISRSTVYNALKQIKQDRSTGNHDQMVG